MADIAVENATYDISVMGGDLVFTSDTSFVETMRQRIKATLLTFLGEYFLDDPASPTVGLPYFQSLFEQKIPTIELADSIFRTALLAIKDVIGVESLTFDHDRSTRALSVEFKVLVTGRGNVVEDIIVFI
jgi:hypothetical protein